MGATRIGHLKNAYLENAIMGLIVPLTIWKERQCEYAGETEFRSIFVRSPLDSYGTAHLPLGIFHLSAHSTDGLRRTKSGTPPRTDHLAAAQARCKGVAQVGQRNIRRARRLSGC